MMSAMLSLAPEILLVLTALALLIVGAFRGDKSAGPVLGASLVALAVSSFLLLGAPSTGVFFSGMIVADAFGQFVKLVLLLVAALTLLVSENYFAQRRSAKPEYAILVLFATVGMMLMISAHHLMALYVGLELQSLSLYVLAAYNRDESKSSEAGLKYFVLGSLASCLLLFGTTFIYGSTGVLDYPFALEAKAAVLGLVLVLAGLAFKVAAVPFHMWAPDVYEGAPTPVSAFFATAPKFAALIALVRLLDKNLPAVEPVVIPILVVLAGASLIVGAVAGLMQTNLKRLMAYSSIANAGFLIVGLAAWNIEATLIYAVLYAAATLGIFAVIIGMPGEKISDLSGFSKTHPVIALAVAFFLFSLAGLPPLAGFFGKYFVLLAAVKAHMVPLAVVGVLASVISGFYYLRIVKVMYFDDVTHAALDYKPSLAIKLVVALMAAVVLLFIFAPSFLIEAAHVAAESLA